MGKREINYGEEGRENMGKRGDKLRGRGERKYGEEGRKNMGKRGKIRERVDNEIEREKNKEHGEDKENKQNDDREMEE